MLSRTVAMAIVACGLLGCAQMPIGPMAEGPTSGPPPAALPMGSRSAALFAVQEREELFFQVQSIGAWATVSAGPGSTELSRDQRLQVSGTVTDPTGARPFVISRFLIDELRDDRGRDLLATGMANTSPSSRSPNYFSPPSPGSARSMSFSVSVQGLTNLPSSLSVIRGRVAVAVPGASEVVELAGLLGEGQSEPIPGMRVRVRTYPRHGNDSLSAQVEYILTRPDADTGSPMVVGLTIYDQKGGIIIQDARTMEHAAGEKVVGVIPIQCGLGGRTAARWELEVARWTREVEFEFEAEDVTLARGGGM